MTTITIPAGALRDLASAHRAAAEHIMKPKDSVPAGTDVGILAVGYYNLQREMYATAIASCAAVSTEIADIVDKIAADSSTTEEEAAELIRVYRDQLSTWQS